MPPPSQPPPPPPLPSSSSFSSSSSRSSYYEKNQQWTALRADRLALQRLALAHPDPECTFVPNRVRHAVAAGRDGARFGGERVGRDGGKTASKLTQSRHPDAGEIVVAGFESAPLALPQNFPPPPPTSFSNAPSSSTQRPPPSFWKDLHAESSRKNERIKAEQAAAEARREKEELEECTFRPMLERDGKEPRRLTKSAGDEVSNQHRPSRSACESEPFQLRLHRPRPPSVSVPLNPVTRWNGGALRPVIIAAAASPPSQSRAMTPPAAPLLSSSASSIVRFSPRLSTSTSSDAPQATTNIDSPLPPYAALSFARSPKTDVDVSRPATPLAHPSSSNSTVVLKTVRFVPSVFLKRQGLFEQQYASRADKVRADVQRSETAPIRGRWHWKASYKMAKRARETLRRVGGKEAVLGLPPRFRRESFWTKSSRRRMSMFGAARTGKIEVESKTNSIDMEGDDDNDDDDDDGYDEDEDKFEDFDDDDLGGDDEEEDEGDDETASEQGDTPSDQHSPSPAAQFKFLSAAVSRSLHSHLLATMPSGSSPSALPLLPSSYQSEVVAFANACLKAVLNTTERKRGSQAPNVIEHFVTDFFETARRQTNARFLLNIRAGGGGEAEDLAAASAAAAASVSSDRSLLPMPLAEDSELHRSLASFSGLVVSKHGSATRWLANALFSGGQGSSDFATSSFPARLVLDSAEFLALASGLQEEVQGSATSGEADEQREESERAADRVATQNKARQTAVDIANVTEYLENSSPLYGFEGRDGENQPSSAGLISALSIVDLVDHFSIRNAPFRRMKERVEDCLSRIESAIHLRSGGAVCIIDVLKFANGDKGLCEIEDVRKGLELVAEMIDHPSKGDTSSPNDNADKNKQQQHRRGPNYTEMRPAALVIGGVPRHERAGEVESESQEDARRASGISPASTVTMPTPFRAKNMPKFKKSMSPHQRWSPFRQRRSSISQHKLSVIAADMDSVHSKTVLNNLTSRSNIFESQFHAKRSRTLTMMRKTGGVRKFFSAPRLVSSQAKVRESMLFDIIVGKLKSSVAADEVALNKIRATSHNGDSEADDDEHVEDPPDLSRMESFMAMVGVEPKSTVAKSRRTDKIVKADEEKSTRQSGKKLRGRSGRLDLKDRDISALSSIDDASTSSGEEKVTERAPRPSLKDLSNFTIQSVSSTKRNTDVKIPSVLATQSHSNNNLFQRLHVQDREIKNKELFGKFEILIPTYNGYSFTFSSPAKDAVLSPAQQVSLSARLARPPEFGSAALRKARVPPKFDNSNVAGRQRPPPEEEAPLSHLLDKKLPAKDIESWITKQDRAERAKQGGMLALRERMFEEIRTWSFKLSDASRALLGSTYGKGKVGGAISPSAEREGTPDGRKSLTIFDTLYQEGVTVVKKKKIEPRSPYKHRPTIDNEETLQILASRPRNKEHFRAGLKPKSTPSKESFKPTLPESSRKIIEEDPNYDYRRKEKERVAEWVAKVQELKREETERLERKGLKSFDEAIKSPKKRSIETIQKHGVKVRDVQKEGIDLL